MNRPQKFIKDECTEFQELMSTLDKMGEEKQEEAGQGGS